MSHSADAELSAKWRADQSTFLTWEDRDTVQALLAEIAPSWSAELNNSGPDGSTIVATPAGANDLLGPAFVLHRDRGRVRLDQFRWDEYREIGAFATLHQALTAMTARLVPLVTPRPAAALDR